MEKVIITGASGFVGQNLQKYLEGDFEIIKVGRSEKKTYDSLTLSDDIFAVIHLAGKAHDTKNVTQPEEYYIINYELTKKIFHEFLNSEAKIFVYMSSVKAVRDSVETILTETVVPNPQTHYGKSKLMAEEYLLSNELPKNKKIFILRPCMIHGKGNKGNLNLLYKFAKSKIPYPLAAFENKRSFLYVDNLCFVIKKLITEENIPTGIYQVADDVPISTKELFNVISQNLNYSPVNLSIPANFLRQIAKIGDKLHLPLTSERLKKLTENYIVSNQKIKNALGIQKLPIDVIDGINRTINNFNE